jgi:cbb3-type cytochrome oxidase cytochrome c subunit
MPAAEETYRKQPILHAIFALTSIAMTLSIIWMIMADHLRPWKKVQREFQRVEQAKLSASQAEKEKQLKEKSQADIDRINNDIKRANETAEMNYSEIRKLEASQQRIEGRYQLLDTRKKFQKAELDSKRSLYDGLIDRDDAKAAGAYLSSTIIPAEKEYNELSREFEVAAAERARVKEQLDALRGNVDKYNKELERLTSEVDRVRRALEQNKSVHGAPGSMSSFNDIYANAMAWLRNIPGIDLMPPTKIQQISLPELTINYNFKEVPRYDRCTTCHQGIDKLGFDKDDQGGMMRTSHPAFATHSHFTDGATTVDPTGKVVKAGLYLDGNGPHPINSFGCTICHGGQGSGTDFTYSSHEPNDLAQEHEWEEKYHWHKIHHWDEPMLPSRFLQSSCLKCHHEVTDVPQADKLQAGYKRIVRYGCTGCHTIGGPGSFGPDLTEEPQVGPNLAHVGKKVDAQWLLKWIKNPHAFRPDSRMPRFYGVTTTPNHAEKDWPKNHAEIHAIAHYLNAKSTDVKEFVDPPAKSDAAHGKDLFLQKGCMACHSHRTYAKNEIQPQDKNDANKAYFAKPTGGFDPGTFPEPAREYASADFGPNLSNIAAKFQSNERGHKWLTNWIRSPESYHPRSLMPNLQLSLQDAADIAAWIMSVPGEWPVNVEVPEASSPTVDAAIKELVRHYVSKAGGIAIDGKFRSVPLSETASFVNQQLTSDQRLMYLGERTISRLGCFGCHNIPGFENAKPIGTPLNGWGIKSPAKLDYGHIFEYIQDQPLGDDGARDGTDRYYQQQLSHQTRSGFLYQKLHRPRSYDFDKTDLHVKAWDDRLRMPQFAWANDPRAIEEVMTFVLGLTGEKINARYLPKTRYSPAQFAKAKGEKFLSRHNCTGCHVLDMPKYRINVPATALEVAMPNFKTNVDIAYGNRAADYLSELYPDLKYDPKMTPKLDAAQTQPVEIEGMPVSLIENELTVQLWRPVTIRGFTFNVGDNVTLDQTKVEAIKPHGGNFAWLYAYYESDRTGSDFGGLWNRLPPPLLREGLKVQTPWLTAFLRDPYPIRPAANLRMPRFHFGRDDKEAMAETTGLANYFAARDGAEFPYQVISERTQEHLSKAEAKHPDYLAAGWTTMTKGACIQCHAVGPFKPTGGAPGSNNLNGPDLRQVSNRFRPRYLEEWLANPKRLVPYTAMPQNVPPEGPMTPAEPPKTFEKDRLDLVKAVRDALLNYVDVVEQQLAGAKGEAPKPSAAKPGASE